MCLKRQFVRALIEGLECTVKKAIEKHKHNFLHIDRVTTNDFDHENKNDRNYYALSTDNWNAIILEIQRKTIFFFKIPWWNSWVQLQL